MTRDIYTRQEISAVASVKAGEEEREKRGKEGRKIKQEKQGSQGARGTKSVNRGVQGLPSGQLPGKSIRSGAGNSQQVS